MAGGLKHRHGLNWENWVTFTLCHSIRQELAFHYRTWRRFLLKMERAGTQRVPGKFSSSQCRVQISARRSTSQRFPYILERGSQGAKQSSPAPGLKDQRETESTTVHSNFTLDSTSEPWYRKSMSILPVEHFSAFDLAKFLLDAIEGEDFMTCAAANWQWLII